MTDSSPRASKRRLVRTKIATATDESNTTYLSSKQSYGLVRGVAVLVSMPRGSEIRVRTPLIDLELSNADDPIRQPRGDTSVSNTGLHLRVEWADTNAGADQRRFGFVVDLDRLHELASLPDGALFDPNGVVFCKRSDAVILRALAQ
ncbi:hypothetical protein MBLNU459_g2548t1 [Dothideomycetes sp. NU459]